MRMRRRIFREEKTRIEKKDGTTQWRRDPNNRLRREAFGLLKNQLWARKLKIYWKVGC